MPHVLKRLELNGFKSFAQKTLFNFPAGITAIVGPNGSGKSNIVDAIRWLLGEREAKNLRGSKVEDLIFAGTPKRPRMGQAQATLHFENESKFFPLDAAEVSITRQIARDGTSRYFLNKAEMLLRDLIDFFAKARLGSRGLVVITQGNADVFIRSSPHERREMIEEILGLREYQIKKLDAERRLKNSESNLEKARVLIEEILPHLRSLRRQTSRWEKRGELEEELKTLENDFFGTQCAALKSEMAAVAEKMEAQKKELGALHKERDAAVDAQKKIEASQPEERKRVLKIREDIRALLENRSGLEKETARIEAQLELAEKATGMSEQSAANMTHFIEEVRDRLEMSLESDADTIREAIEGIIADMNSFFEDADGAARRTPEFSALREKFDALAKNLERIKKDLLSLRDEEKSLEANQEEFYSAFKHAVSGVEAARKKIEAWENRNRECVFERQRLELREEELLRHIAQAGRNAREFESASGEPPRPAALGEARLGEAARSPHALAEAEKRIFKLRGDLASIGAIDEALLGEARETARRYEFLEKESADLTKAVADLRGLIGDLNKKIKSEFEVAIVKINEEFSAFFAVMFGGGRAKLRVIRPQATPASFEAVAGEEAASPAAREDAGGEEPEVEEDGVEIDLKLPRKKITSLDVLSGGERSLVGIAALFALISVSPPPFLVLDEVDAALDDRNSKRFSDMLKEFSKETQFVVVTHNRATMEVANVLYGITLNDDGTSKVLSMKFDEAEKVSASVTPHAPTTSLI